MQEIFRKILKIFVKEELYGGNGAKSFSTEIPSATKRNT